MRASATVWWQWQCTSEARAICGDLELRVASYLFLLKPTLTPFGHQADAFPLDKTSSDINLFHLLCSEIQIVEEDNLVIFRP